MQDAPNFQDGIVQVRLLMDKQGNVSKVVWGEESSPELGKLAQSYPLPKRVKAAQQCDLQQRC
ncbi:hypothetical protein QEO96_09660 [Kingella negevensis]|nr:hypothetical protein [Kingella negevensis]MDK4693794.1 hypothetical protein [Kingella negevensis]